MFGLNRVKSRLLYRYIISYLLVFLIPFIVMSVIIYYNSVSSLRKEIEQSNIDKLQQVENITAERMKELEQIAARISYDPRLTPYMMNHNYYGREATDELKKYKANSSIIERLFVYYHEDGKVYSAEGSYTFDMFTQKMYQFDAWEKEELENDLHTKRPIVKPADNVTVNNFGKGRIIAFLYPITPNNPNPYGTVMYFVDESVLTNLIQNILGQFQGNIYVFDENNQVVASDIKDRRINQEDLSRVINSNRKVDNVTLNGKDYSVVTVKSEANGWTFVTLMATDQFFKQVVHTRVFVMLLLISIVFAGIAAAILLGRKQYEPIQNISELIKVNRKQNADVEGNNELETISNTITKVFKDHQILSETMYLQRPFVREQILTKLLKGDLKDDQEIDNLLNSLNVNLKGGEYFVATVYFDKGTFAEENMKEREDVFNSLSQISLRGARAFGVDLFYDDMFALVVNIDKVSAGKDHIRKTVSKIKQYVLDSSLIVPTIGVGNPYHEVNRINRSFIEALAAMEYKFVNPQGSIIYFDEIGSQQGKTLGYPKEEQLKLIQSIKQGDQSVAIEALTNMFGSLKRKELSLSILKTVCFDIINTVLKTASEIGLSEQIHDFEKVVDFTSIKQLEKDLHALVLQICKEVDIKKASHTIKLRDAILDYIDHNYKEYNLSLDYLAEKFQLSVSYVSRFIKEQTGVTFTQYVLELRMREVKRQLKDTSYSIKKIVTDVGYKDVANFIRKFKKIEGMTPGQYRKLNR